MTAIVDRGPVGPHSYVRPPRTRPEKYENLAFTFCRMGTVGLIAWAVTPPVFGLIQRLGGLEPAELYRVFNMGVGFCLAVPPEQCQAALAALRRSYPSASVLGVATADPDHAIVLEPLGLIGQGNAFRPR